MSEWYCSVSNQTRGPYSETQMKEMLRAGEITSDTMVYSPEGEQAKRGWVRAGYTSLTIVDLPRWKAPDSTEPYTPPRPFYNLAPGNAYAIPRIGRAKVKPKIKKWLASLALLAALVTAGAFAFSHKFTLFVLQPTNSGPGEVMLMLRTNDFNFIDSADGMFLRQQLTLEFMGRSEIQEAVVSKSKALVRFPYSEWLYQLSLGR